MHVQSHCTSFVASSFPSPSWFRNKVPSVAPDNHTQRKHQRSTDMDQGTRKARGLREIWTVVVLVYCPKELAIWWSFQVWNRPLHADVTKAGIHTIARSLKTVLNDRLRSNRIRTFVWPGFHVIAAMTQWQRSWVIIWKHGCPCWTTCTRIKRRTYWRKKDWRESERTAINEKS